MPLDIDAIKAQATEAVAAALGDAYDCLRTWNAWGAGTMSGDDFALVSEDADRLDEIVEAALATVRAAIAAQS